MKKAALDLNETAGIAMYLEIPEVTATNFVIRLIDPAGAQASIGTNVELTYVSLDGETIVKEPNCHSPTCRDLKDLFYTIRGSY